MGKMLYYPIVLLTDDFQYKKVLLGTQKLRRQAIGILSDIYCNTESKVKQERQLGQLELDP